MNPLALRERRHKTKKPRRKPMTRNDYRLSIMAQTLNKDGKWAWMDGHSYSLTDDLFQLRQCFLRMIASDALYEALEELVAAADRGESPSDDAVNAARTAISLARGGN